MSAVSHVTTIAAARTFADVYAAQFPAMVRLAYVTAGNLAVAEDLVQDAFAELYRRFGEVVSPVPYVRRAVVSRCISWHRRRLLELRWVHHAAGWLDSETAPLGPDATAVRSALQKLKPRQRAAVFLRFYLDLPESEIAQALGCRPGTVKSLLHRGLTELREHLQ